MSEVFEAIEFPALPKAPFKAKVWPHGGISKGIDNFGDSLTVQSELEHTLISNILKKFEVTGVLPTTGRVAMPADVFLGGDDFQSLRERLDEAQRAGITEDALDKLQNGDVNDEHEHNHADTDDSQHGTEGGVAAPVQGQQSAGE